MPRDVMLGEGYDGDTQVIRYAPGHHSGQYCVTDGSATLMQVGEMPDQGYGMRGMGSITEMVIGALAGGQLDKLRDGIGKLSDAAAQIATIRTATFNGYVEAQGLLDDAQASEGLTIAGPFGPIPNPAALPALIASQTAIQAVQFLARMVFQTSQTSTLYAYILTVLTDQGMADAADMVRGSLSQIQRIIQDVNAQYIGPTGDPSKAIIPDFGSTTLALRAEFANELQAAGVATGEYDNPLWIQTMNSAADKIVPLPDDAKQAAGVSGLGALGLADPVSWTVVLIYTIGIIAAAVVAIIALTRLIPDANLQAREAAKLIQQRASDWTGVETQMRAQGKSQAEIDTARAAWDQQTGKQASNIPKPPSLFEGILGPVGLALAAGVAFLALRK